MDASSDTNAFDTAFERGYYSIKVTKNEELQILERR
jgi:hypothetical protein